MKRKGSCVILNAWGKKENYGISFHRVVKVIIFARGNNSTKGREKERKVENSWCKRINRSS